jgi:hypothetical protein
MGITSSQGSSASEIALSGERSGDGKIPAAYGLSALKRPETGPNRSFAG